MTESLWDATKRRAKLVGAFFAELVIETVKGIFYVDETEPFRRRRRKSDHK
jgi:hypothetical protein